MDEAKAEAVAEASGEASSSSSIIEIEDSEHGSEDGSRKKIKLYLSNPSNRTIFVWNAEDIYTLRKHHRIVGALIGVDPYKPGQIKKRHVPLKLMLEEALLLVEKGIAELCQTPDSPPDETIAQKMRETRDKICDEQGPLGKEMRQKEILAKCEDPEIAQKKSEEVKDFPKEDAFVQIFTECPWKDDNVTLLKSPISYPRNMKEKVMYEVFKDLWEKKMYITSGTKFGGDFLVYEGDPHLFHALYIVVCLCPDQKIQGLDIVTYGRLGKQVKKTVALASLNEENKVEYISLEYVPDI